jgi:hypothetical protein
MSVRKRTWTTARGEIKEAWIVDYIYQDSDRAVVSDWPLGGITSLSNARRLA